ncbi:MAG: archaellin/type IV pilin N-terminal domain-containing protein [Candidatus Pacearchaeota archaeon]
MPKERFYLDFFENKKAISEIMAALLIILFVIIAAAIIWVVIRNVLYSSSEEIDLGGSKIYLSIEDAYVDDQQDLNVVVARDSGEGELKGLRFLFDDGGDRYTVDRMVIISELGKRTFKFNSTEIGVNVNFIDKISVAYFYGVGSRENRTGPITDSLEISTLTYLLNLTKIGNGLGTVTSNPVGINCGTTCPSQEYYYKANIQVTLTASPSLDSVFSGWELDAASCGTNPQCSITLSSNKNVRARFSSGVGGEES